MRLLFLLNTLYFYYIAISVALVYSFLGDIFKFQEYTFINFYLPILLIAFGVGFYTVRLFVFANDENPKSSTKIVFLLFYLGCFLVGINYPLFSGLCSASTLISLSIAIAVVGTFIEGGFILLANTK
ncbi:hypothetical protein [Neolewinella persica]|uniref:hypothetical protein n=1 Tax=Neolewinella persica TaxID=70998 RepID=UPI000380CA9A|nr:hypothetical protein [Neolewinella persica]